MKYIEFNNKRLGPLTQKQYKTLIKIINNFDDFNVLGENVYLYKDETKYIFKLDQLNLIHIPYVQRTKKIDLNKKDYSLILDVGASYGNFSIPLASQKTKIIALEYDLELFSCLVSNIKFNKKNTLVQPVLISDDLFSEKQISPKNRYRTSSLIEILKIIQSDTLQLIRFDKRIEEESVHKLLNNLDRKLLPENILHEEKYLKI
tara:strand:- start:17280 stop:17891 length:612 start_codon:yes stop_codon:yes gene_type:complete